MGLEIRQLRHVLALAELGSFSRAAAMLNLSQPALSRSVQGVEKLVGTALFVRGASGVVPTDTGRVLAQRAREVVQATQDIEDELRAGRGLQTGQLRVGTGPFPMDMIITPALTRFVAMHPLVSVHLQLADWDALLPRLRSHELDFFVAEITTLQREPDLAVQPLSAHPLYFVGRRGHPLAQRPSVRPDDTFAFPFASPSRIPPRLLAPMLAAKARSAEGAHAARPFPTVECNVVSAVKRVVECTDTVTALTLSCMAAELRDERMSLLGSEPWMSLHYGVVRLKTRPLNSAAQRLHELVLAAEAAVTQEEEDLLAHLRAGKAARPAALRARKPGQPARR